MFDIKKKIVNYETAILLNEAGFKRLTGQMYLAVKPTSTWFNDDDICISAPTITEAMAWLVTRHNIKIISTNLLFGSALKIVNGSTKKKRWVFGFCNKETYNKAIVAAIKLIPDN